MKEVVYNVHTSEQLKTKIQMSRSLYNPNLKRLRTNKWAKNLTLSGLSSRVSNLVTANAYYTEEPFSCFPSVLPVNCRYVCSVSHIQQVFPFRYLPVHRLLIFLPCDDIQAPSFTKQWAHCPPATRRMKNI